MRRNSCSCVSFFFCSFRQSALLLSTSNGSATNSATTVRRDRLCRLVALVRSRLAQNSLFSRRHLVVEFGTLVDNQQRRHFLRRLPRPRISYSGVLDPLKPVARTLPRARCSPSPRSNNISSRSPPTASCRLGPISPVPDPGRAGRARRRTRTGLDS
jgi:hypothetical protein